MAYLTIVKKYALLAQVDKIPAYLTWFNPQTKQKAAHNMSSFLIYIPVVFYLAPPLFDLAPNYF